MHLLTYESSELETTAESKGNVYLGREKRKERGEKKKKRQKKKESSFKR